MGAAESLLTIECYSNFEMSQRHICVISSYSASQLAQASAVELLQQPAVPGWRMHSPTVAMTGIIAPMTACVQHGVRSLARTFFESA